MVHFRVPMVVLKYPGKDTTSGMAAAIEATVWPSLWQSTIIHPSLFGFCKSHEISGNIKGLIIPVPLRS